MPSHEQLYILRKARRLYRPEEDTRELCEPLLAEGLLEKGRSWFRKGLGLTRKGREALIRAAHSRDKVGRAIAAGLFDHVSFDLFLQLIASPEIESYIEGQKNAQRWMLLTQLSRRW